VHKLHKKISDKVNQNNANYNLRADVRNNVGDVKKLHSCTADPFQILNKLNDNAYIIDLPKDFDTSSTY